MLEQAYYVIVSREVKPDGKRDTNAFTSEVLQPVEALEKYFELKNISDEHRKVLLEYGENLIKEAISEKEEQQGS
jgi:hypothetical protein